MAISIFGYTLSRNEEKIPANQNYVTPALDDGATSVQAGGYFGTYVDMDASAKSENDLLTRYREISQYPDCAMAIDEIVNEAISSFEDDLPLTLDLDKLDLGENIKQKIKDEFDHILNLLEFNNYAFDIFRQWYVDGRLYYQKIIDTEGNRGILELRGIDPRKIKKVRNVKKEKLPSGIEVVKEIEEFFIYNDKGLVTRNTTIVEMPTQGIKILPDAITYVTSGLLDQDKNIVLSHLHKAIKPVNQLKMMEDSLVIYRLSRAPERRIFYIDVGNLPKIKAEQYLKDIMARYRNKIVYDSATGEIRDDRKFMSMLEDFWLPRREGGRGTEITTLPGGENLGQIDDVNYFQNKLYQSLNVPLSRMQQQSTGFNFGRAAEISRDELKFAKFVSRLRTRFNLLFNDLLRTQLILKKVIVDKDWDSIKNNIKYKYAQDQYYVEMKDADNLRNRVDLLTQVVPFAGVYISKKYIMKKILRMSDEEIEENEEEINNEGPPEPVPGVTMQQPSALQPEQQQ
ncbi:MAG: portal protein [Proteobacteria bacterium]|nr:portal protein [Pseudomonadota bacterium]NBP13422.1 portal protein [bacterium]